MRVRSLLLAAMLPALAGCYSKATAHDGKFTFAYASMVEHDNFVKPIAPGAKLEMHAFANGTSNQLTVKSARSSKPDVVAVQSVKDRSVVVLGKTPGVAEIEVTAQDASGAELVDKMFFHVARPSTHAIEHACTEEPEAVYVRGEEVVVHHDLRTSDRRPVIGYDYAPLKIEPSGALELMEQPQAGGYYLFTAKSARSRVTIRSSIDDKVLTMRIVDRKDLKTASLLHTDRMLEGDAAWLVARVSSGGDAPLCNQTALTRARSLTPSICKVTARLEDDPDEKDENREQLARITALAFGVCKFEVTLPELNGGKGVTLTGEAKVGREEWPGERKIGTKVREGLIAWSRPLLTIAAMKEALALAVFTAWWLKSRMRRRWRTRSSPIDSSSGR